MDLRIIVQNCIAFGIFMFNIYRFELHECR